ncbi:methenyltetrahydrofolate cyclohydrolase [Tumebacillus algifaecis]|uniref:Methenyltetrahydrofolate cyclohydrolase n=1 Tax=Tumebacillus algifaecis TaxID=1214604 RepID=A0A223D3M9_9BACL|nr:cyclodeaminase/cyclohydrolase family protein [Tumebacillus algifaecis]ASS76229.1 methenyltetrahydrofolate cyclohydrolase [Tumebacillus algifaecis]
MATFDQSLHSFLTQAASNSPTPGGGSVAALVAALGASMTSMVGNLTQGDKFADVQAEMTAAAEQMAAAIRSFEQLLEADMSSFDRYMAALKLPKDSAEQKVARSQALQEASIKATEVPLDLARLCLDSLHLSETIADTANKNVISDLGIAALLLEAAAQSALLTVDMNLPGLKDLARKADFESERNRIANAITPLKDKIVATVRKRLA